MHIRRGDYLKMTDVFHVLDHEYYDRALVHLLGRALLQQPSVPVKLLLFAEPDAARHARTMAGYFQVKYPGALTAECVAVSDADRAVGELDPLTQKAPSDVLELLMMSHCDDVIMANSSFSWWGAYLNERRCRRVVAPMDWFVRNDSSHLYCRDWVVL